MTKPLDLALPDGRVVSGLMTTDTPTAGTPLLVVLPGGSYNASYFDVAGHSLFERAAANGVRVVGLDRPGYGRSSPLAPDERDFVRQAEILSETIRAVWSTRHEDHPGIVLLGHSIGGAIAVHVAASHPDWPLLGLAIHGIGTEPSSPVADVLETVPLDTVVHFTAVERGLMYGAPGTYPPDVLELTAEACEPIPSEEAHEVNGPWTSEVGDLAARVRVPVQCLLSADDGLWVTDDRRLRDLAVLFGSAPRVSARLVEGAGHNLDHHHLGPAIHLLQLGFVLECGVLGMLGQASPTR